MIFGVNQRTPGDYIQRYIRALKQPEQTRNWILLDDGRSKLGADAGGDEVALPGGADRVDAAEERLSVLMARKKQQFKKYDEGSYHAPKKYSANRLNSA